MWSLQLQVYPYPIYSYLFLSIHVYILCPYYAILTNHTTSKVQIIHPPTWLSAWGPRRSQISWLLASVAALNDEHPGSSHRRRYECPDTRSGHTSWSKHGKKSIPASIGLVEGCWRENLQDTSRRKHIIRNYRLLQNLSPRPVLGNCASESGAKSTSSINRSSDPCSSEFAPMISLSVWVTFSCLQGYPCQ